MSDPTKKTCGQCGAVHPASNEFFGTDKQQPDSLRKICKECYSDNRYGDRTKAVQALRIHDKLVAKAKKQLAEQLSNLTPGQIEKYERIVRLNGEHRAELQGKVLGARKAEEDAQRQAAAAPSWTLVQQHFGSPILLSMDEMRASLEKARVALGNLTGPDDGPARKHVEDYIGRVAYTVEQHDKQEAEMARDAQEALNEKVRRRVIGRVMDLYLPQIRAAVSAEAKIVLREKIRARKKSLLEMASTATGKDKSGADIAVVARAIANALEKLALMLYSGTKAELPHDTLENLQSRIDSGNAAQEELERAEAERRKYWDELRQSNPKQFERESKSLVLQIKGTGPFADIQRKSMQQLKREDPAEYERRALDALKPRTVVPQQVIYVVMEGKREIWYWPDGRLVKKGEEVTFDFRQRRWCLMPGPAGVELDPVVAGGVQNLEGYYDDRDCDEEGYPKWKYRPEGSAGTYSQQRDGSWKKDASSESPWTKVEKIQFVRAEPPASAAHTEFRHGKFWTVEDVQKADAADAANPPNLLPPLPRYAVADTLALPPPITAADRAKDAKPLETVWQRGDRLRREQAEREQALLRGN